MTCPPHKILYEDVGTREGCISMGRCIKRGCDETRMGDNLHSSQRSAGWIGIDYKKRKSVARGGAISRQNQSARAKRRAT